MHKIRPLLCFLLSASLAVGAPVSGSSLNISGNATIGGTATINATVVTGNITAGSFSGPLTGNVTGNVSGTAPAGSLTGSTLASGVTASSLTGVGTISSGAWHGTMIGNAYGGTGIDTSASTGFGKFASGVFSVESAAMHLSSIGGTTAGINLFKLTNPSAISFIRVNADNSIDALSASAFRTAIGVGTGTGTVVGPGSAVAHRLAGFADTSGDLLEDSGLGVSGGVLTATGFAGPLTGNVTGNVSGTAGSATGNAATATVLQTPRAINGTNFDGSAPITITAAAGTLTGTALNSSVVTSSLTTVGTIGTGVWNGTAVGSGFGGTGQDFSASTGFPKWASGTASIESAGTHLTSIGGTTLGQALFTQTNPSAITFPRYNADNSVSALSASAFRTAIGVGTGTGTVVGPGSATNKGIATYNGTTGDLLFDNSAATITAGVITATGFVGPITGNVTGNVTGTAGSATGNAATATALQTGRAINGTTFDGTAAITVTAAAGTLTGTTLNSTVTDSSLITLGTLTDITTNNASTSAHGFLKKLDNTAAHFMDGTGAWSTPTAAAGGSDTQVQFNNSTAMGGVAGLTVNKTSGALTQLQTSLGTSKTMGIELTNTTAAAAGAQQISPSFRMTGQGWKSNATAASQTVNFDWRVLPVQGTTNATGQLILSSQLNGGGYNDRFVFGDDGGLTVAGLTSSGNCGGTTSVSTGSSGLFFFGGKTIMSSPGDTKIKYANNAQLNGVTITYGTDIVTIKNFGDSANAALTCSTLTCSSMQAGSGAMAGGTLNASTGTFTDNVVTSVAGKTFGVKSGSNAKAGTFTLSSGAATVSNTSVTANSVISFTVKTVSGTVAAAFVSATSVGTSFTMSGGALDNSTYNYVIMEVN